MRKPLIPVFTGVFVIVFLASLIAQTADPRPPVTWWYKVRNYIQNGQFTMTYKTLTSPTITDPTITGIAAFDSLSTDSLNVAGQLVMATTAPIYLRDATEQIYSSVDGQLDIDAATEVEIATTTLDLNGALDVSGTTTLAGKITQAVTQSTDDYSWLQYSQWSTGADMAAGGSYGIYGKANVGHTVQNVIGGKGAIKFLTLAADESINYGSGFEATLELDDADTYTITVTDHISALNLYFDGSSKVAGVGGGAYSKMNLSRAMWNSTENFAIETNGYQVETAPNSYLDYGFNVYNDGTMNAGLWIHNNRAHGTMISDILTSSGARIFTGTAVNGDAVYAEVGAVDATGSIYLSTGNGYLYIQVANAGAAADWYKVTAADTD